MKQLNTALRLFLFLSLLTGLAYPLLVTALAQLFFPREANGSLMEKSGKVVGSELIAQAFKADKYFWPRPSAVDYNPLPSGGSNLGPTSKALAEKWHERRNQGFQNEMLAASASGLDPHISLASANAQLKRVAIARGKSEADIQPFLQSVVEGKQLGFLGETRVNVLKLNVLLDEKMK